MAALIPLGQIEAAGDLTTAALVRQNLSDSQMAVDERAAVVAGAVIADSPEVKSAAATAATAAISAAGDRTFYRVQGPAQLLADPEFAVAPSSATTAAAGIWYNVTGALSWETITDGPSGATRVIRATAANTYFRQRATGFTAAGLAGKTVTIRIRSRALTVGANVVAPIRVLISLVSSGATLLDTRLSNIPITWTDRDVAFTIPSDIGTGVIQFSFAVHGGAPVGSGQIEFDSVHMFVPNEDLPTVVRTEVSAAISSGGIGGWKAATFYAAGSVVLTALGHRVRAVESHTSAAVRFTDDLPKWRPLDAPANEPMLLGRARLGHGQSIGVGNKSVIALRFDDWHVAFRDNVLPLLTARGLPAALATVSDLTVQPWSAGITGADIASWNRQGVEIQSHGLDHKDPSPHDLTGAGGLYDQIVASKAMIESWGVRCRGWMQPGATGLIPGVTPYGTSFTTWDSLDQYAAWLIRDTYPVSEMYVWGSISRPIPHGQFHGADHVTISDGMTYASVMSTLEQRIVRGENIELMIHAGNLGGAGNITLAEFTQVLDWIVAQRDAGKAEVLTPSGLFFADRTTNRADAILNGSFAEGTYGWSNFGTGRTLEATGGRTGPNFVHFGATETGLINQSLLTLASRGWDGQTFMFEGWARAQSGTTTSRVTLSGGALAADLTRENIGTAWTPVRHAFTMPPGVTTVAVGIGRSAGSAIDWDDITVRPV